MKKINKIYLILIIIFFILSLGIFNFRLDLTKDKRYTLSEVSKNTIQNTNQKAVFDIYLEGDFPASFKQLQHETKNILLELKNKNSNIDFNFIDPIETKIPLDSLKNLGIEPSILPDVQDGKVSEILIYPYAVLKSNNQKVAIPLLSKKMEQDPIKQLNNSIEELEYKFINAINKINKNKLKKIGFLTNHDEIKPKQFAGFMELTSKDFMVGPYFPSDQKLLNLQDIKQMKQLDVLVIAKPRKKIEDQEKVVLDQYLMNGGKLFWMLDPVNAEMDSLFRSNKILAFPQDLNLTDYFFSYGIRINGTIIKDYQRNAPIRLVTGEIQGNPQYSNFQWSYFPLGINETSHQITKNINPVKFEFASPIEILPTSGINKTILYKTSDYTTIKQVPNYIELSEVIQMNDSIISDKFVPSQALAVLLEGNFNSIYKDRIENTQIPDFKSSTNKGKMIVVSDGDIAKNALYKGEPIPLGIDVLINKTYGNPDFILNALEYLTDDSNIMELRNRTLDVSLLDKSEIIKNEKFWKYFNIFIPLLFVILLGIIMIYIKKIRFK